MVYILLLFFVSLKVCYSLDAVSRMWTSFLKCVAALKRLKHVGLDHPYITHLAMPFAGYCQRRAEHNSRKFGRNRWHWGRFFFSLFCHLLQYNFTKAPCFFQRGGISRRQNITPKRRKIGIVSIWWAEQIGKLLITQFPRTSCYFLSLKINTSFCSPF